MNWTITGLDGCGKDTQISLIQKKLKSMERKINAYSIWNSLSVFSEIDNAHIKKMLDIFLTQFEPSSRSLFLQSLLVQSEKKMDTNPKNLNIFNSGYYKYAASEITLGAPLHLWVSFIQASKKSDKIIYIKTSRSEIEKRKPIRSTYENLVWNKWNDYERNLELLLQNEENVIIINGNQTIDNVFMDIKNKVFN